MIQNFDIIIVGGGMVGAAVACGLGNSHLKVAVIEKSLPNVFSNQQTHDLRVSALSIASKNILQMVGAWQGVLNRRYCPFKRMRVFESTGETEFCSDAIGHEELGFIVENRVIQLALLDKIQHFENIKLFAPATIKKMHYSSVKTQLELDDGQSLCAKVLIAADGGQSRIRQNVGLGVSSWDYQQHALIIYVETEYPQQDITWQRFTPTGPQAFLPLTDHYGSIVWYHSADEIRRLKALPYNALMQELIHAFPDCLGSLTQILGVASFPLKRQHAQSYVKQGIALVGDAAHIINPLAGQGVNIGLLDAAALAEVLIDADKKSEDIADLAVLKRYEALRRPENLKMMTVMDIFYRVFSNKIIPIKFLRNLGLELAGRVLPVKNKIMKAAMGLEGNLPKLARGKSLH